MADKKISQLSSASTPLAGTEVLPIVQSSTTVKVSADDLTVKNVRSNATTGILQIAGPAAAATRVMTVPDANFTSARTDAAQTFTGNQTLGSGNLVIGTAGKGIDFSANGGDVLTQYDEGTWNPTITSGGGTFTTVSATGAYTRIGRLVQISLRIDITSAGTATGVVTSTLPFASANRDSTVFGREINVTGFSLQGTILNGQSTMNIQKYDNSSIITNNAVLVMTGTYML